MELSIILSIIIAMTAGIYYVVNNVFSTDKVKAQSILDHVSEIRLAVDLFKDETGCVPRAIEDLIDREFFISANDDCQEEIKYKQSWNGPYYSKDKFIPCFGDNTLLENSILTTENWSESYQCDSTEEGEPANTGIIDLRHIHRGMKGVLLNKANLEGFQRSRNWDGSYEVNYLHFHTDGTIIGFMNYQEHDPNINIYKIIGATKGVVDELMKICFVHKDGKEYEIEYVENAADDGTPPTTSTYLKGAVKSGTYSAYAHPENLIAYWQGTGYDYWKSPCFYSFHTVLAKSNQIYKANPEAQLNVYIAF